MPAKKPLRIARVEISCYRYPLVRPMETVLGPITARPALIFRVEDGEGAAGWGEAWCNFPPNGAEHRAELAAAVLPGLLGSLDAADPAGAFTRLRASLHRLALQAGEPGPADQIAAAIDIALHDLAARRAGLPLAAYLGGAPRDLPAYASGIDGRQAGDMIAAAQEAGYRAFKLRIGFGRESTLRAIAEARSALRGDDLLMTDANQSWQLPEAIRMLHALGDAPLEWIEEPLAVDRPEAEWVAVAAASPFPVAGGENMRSLAEFEAAAGGSVFGVIQPDVAKWGGLSLVAPLARRIRAAGKRYCPHYLGGGIGLAVSAHLLAAVGGDGLLEIDCNENALREALAGPLLPLRDGLVRVPDGPGLGYEPDVAAITAMRVIHHDLRIAP